MDAFVQRLPRPQPQPPSRSPTRPSPLGERPAKKIKVEIADSDDDDEEDEADTSGITVNDVSDAEDENDRHVRQTAIESALPPVQVDKEAIEEYELMRSSQVSVPYEEEKDAGAERKWVRGKSSIYVDAFNLALDTVLADEAHLFDAKEAHVFEQWKKLGYEAQYLCVLPSLMLLGRY